MGGGSLVYVFDGNRYSQLDSGTRDQMYEKWKHHDEDVVFVNVPGPHPVSELDNFEFDAAITLCGLIEDRDEHMALIDGLRARVITLEGSLHELSQVVSHLRDQMQEMTGELEMCRHPLMDVRLDKENSQK